jgi:hypothetical protein
MDAIAYYFKQMSRTFAVNGTSSMYNQYTGLREAKHNTNEVASIEAIRSS